MTESRDMTVRENFVSEKSTGVGSKLKLGSRVDPATGFIQILNFVGTQNESLSSVVWVRTNGLGEKRTEGERARAHSRQRVRETETKRMRKQISIRCCVHTYYSSKFNASNEGWLKNRESARGSRTAKGQEEELEESKEEKEGTDRRRRRTKRGHRGERKSSTYRGASR